MTNRNLSSEHQQEMTPEPPPNVERQLLPRLKFMGYVMSIFCVATFSYALFASKGHETGVGIQTQKHTNPDTSGPVLMTDENSAELNPAEVLNFYAVSFTFFLVGASCFLIVWKKKKTLF